VDVRVTDRLNLSGQCRRREAAVAATTTTEPTERGFVTVPGDRRSEVARWDLSAAARSRITVAGDLLHRWRRA
jgi:hypothetical protein